MTTPQLAVQMFTVRDFTHTAKQLSATLRKISDIGYRAVQMSAVQAMAGDHPEVDAALARKMLDDNGLACIATHRSWDSLSQHTAAEIEFHHTLGCDFTAIGSLPQEYHARGQAGYAQFLHDSSGVIATLNTEGVRFGYHNHAMEFASIDGQRLPHKTLFDTFIDEAGKSFCLELDLYWICHAGANPERIVERCHGRIPVIHLKDREVIENEPVMAPVGSGNLDWDHLLPACKTAQVEWYAVEQDVCRQDPFECLKASFEFLKDRL